MEQNIITEKIKCHPLCIQASALSEFMDVEFIQKTVAVDLSISYESIKAGYSKSNKRNINKAAQNGVEVFEDDSLQFLDEFIRIYYETMKRNQADDSYFFTKAYFSELMKSSSFYVPKLLLARFQGQIIAGLILLIGKQFAHYHLGGSSTEHLPLRANNLLFDYMIQVCQKTPVKLLHLGGGTNGNDGLLRFKSAFSNNNHFDFYIGKHIINHSIYKELIEASQIEENQFSFFPPYRYIKQ
jgi:lipid II:glycine glycyltransferase (peptidoglycan interpeptide bridge formation enzyme)